MTIFAKRHYEWLAVWAGRELSQAAAFKLAIELSKDDPAFKHSRFIDAANKAREASK